MDALKNAGKVLDSKLASDRAGDLVDFLRSTVSRTSPHLLETIMLTPNPPFQLGQGTYQRSAEPSLDVLVRERTIPLPDALYEQYDLLQCRCFLGLFPELSRAWITIDHRLFLWNYDSKDDFQVFEDQDQVIVSVGLVKPLPGVFLEQINYLLVIATPVEIMLVAMAYTKDNGTPKLNLYRTEIMISSDNVSMTSIIGTENGRIFMCGNNGRLYELQYQAEDGWFTRKCRKIDLTATTYSYFVPTFLNFQEEDPIQKVALDESRKLLYTLSEKSSIEVIYLGPEGKDFKRIAKMSDVFQAAQRSMEGANTYSNSYLDPRTFQIVSIHPIPVPESNFVQLMAVSSSGYRLYFTCYRNAFFANDGKSPSAREPTCLDLSLVKQPPPSRERFRIHESCYSGNMLVASNAVNDEIDAMTCISRERFCKDELFGYDKIEGKTWAIREVAGKSSEDSPRRFIVLTNAELYNGSNIIPWARRIFFELGGKPMLKEDTRVQATAGGSLTPVYCDFIYNRVELIGIDGPLGRPLTSHEYILSGRHDGLSLFLARVLKPVWKERILMRPAKKVKGGPLVEWQFTFSSLTAIQSVLKNLDELLNENPFLTSAPSPSEYEFSSIGGPQTTGEREAWQEEKQSMRNLHTLLKQSIEGIAFLLLLMDFQLMRIVETLPERLVKYMMEESFESLVTSTIGRDIGKELFANIVKMKINEGVGTICDVTQQKCPSFCAMDDVVLFKGMEIVSKVPGESPQTADQLLAESYDLFTTILHYITIEKVHEVCESYRRVNDHLHAIMLCLAYAQSEDSSNLGLSYYLDGSPAGDYREQFFNRRRHCYELIRDILSSLDTQGPESRVGEPNTVDMLAYRDHLITQALGVDDELFHYFVFDWYLESLWTDKLLELNSKYLEGYLGGEPVTLEKIDLLWRYYICKEQFVNAARVLYAIATSKNYTFTFSKRLEMLQLAVTNAKSSSLSVIDTDFLRDLEDKKDVALVQMEIINAVKKENVIPPEDALYTWLLSISDLYTHYAKPLNLYEICLLILHTSEHRDVQLVQQLWSKIIKETMDSPAPDAEKFNALEERVKTLGLRYFPNDNIFPLGFLCSTLEAMTIPKSTLVDSSWVLRLMKSVGVPYSMLFQVYYDLFETKTPPWHSPQAVKYLVKQIRRLLQSWLADVETASNEERHVSFLYKFTYAFHLSSRATFPAKFVDEALSKFIVSQSEDLDVLKRMTSEDMEGVQLTSKVASAPASPVKPSENKLMPVETKEKPSSPKRERSLSPKRTVPEAKPDAEPQSAAPVETSKAPTESKPPAETKNAESKQAKVDDESDEEVKDEKEEKSQVKAPPSVAKVGKTSVQSKELPSDEFAIGTLVWAYVKGYSWWPARVEDESTVPEAVLSVKRASAVYPVLFFGTYEYGWVAPENLRVYSVDPPVKMQKKSKPYLKAVSETSDPSILDDRIAERKRQEEEKAAKAEAKAQKARRKSMPAESKSEKNTPAKTSKKRRASEPGAGESKSKKKREVDYSDEEEEQNGKSSGPIEENGVDDDARERVLKLRKKLQKFLQTEERDDHLYEKADKHLKEVEDMPADIGLLMATGIGKVMRKLSQLELHVDKFNLVERCKEVVEKWKKALP
ncbi:hypothetical protein HDV05_003074 [Chytridiales sp. JEL 0842]|nr:hypothetical protein HDV05_003074 [Chytridiales sp. JEL 0842]